jgi:HEAT repeat protein
MYQDPQLPKPALETRFSPRQVPLWIQALARPEREMQRRAAAAITRAQQKKLPGLDATIEPLIRLLQQSDQDRLVRLTVVQALVALDARQAAPLLMDTLGEGDLDLAEMIEPALARWGHAPMRDKWLQRLRSEVTFRRMHVLAIRGLTALGEVQSWPRLVELAQSRNTPRDVRLGAATALGKMQPDGLEEVARRLSLDKSPQAVADRLVAAKMLESHRGEAADQILTELATDAQPVVQAVALEQLYRHGPHLILPIIDQIVASPDVNVRRWAAEALIAQPAPQTIARLAQLLDDTDPDLRRHVCDALILLAKDASLHDAVIAQGRQLLHANGWRGTEQAILLLVKLDDKSIAGQLLSLLEADRVEVHTTAAWGLSRLAVATTAEPICEVFQQKTDRGLAGGQLKDGTYVQLSHLAQALGRLKHQPADPVLRKYIPKRSVLDPNTRAAALWALGHLHTDRPDDALAQQLLERALDDDYQMPEDFEVRRMAAVSLGRMKASLALDGLRGIVRSNSLQAALGYAAAWSIRELTGEEIAPVPPFINWEDDWFLTPNEQREETTAGG